ncbi:MFS general substrate transporter [Trematosphaeria pertusa]|uniref:MFS general substrate transporter n=1 Tax=Trematosphaeria pertusa TaxID=390896 RepID=A0A6A6HT71_9PLEO|nr:MFS general substrate transporter [Trematosphaeria pertusa]KAF2240968.1 MFS general substrate transporter [Trematosphaeria pertusa]
MAPIVDPEKHEPSSTIRYDTESNSEVEDAHIDLNLRQALRQYSKLVGYVLGLSTVILLWGYDLVVVGSVTALDVFQRDFGEPDVGASEPDKWIIPAIWLSCWQAFPSIGQLFGAISAGPMQDRLGRTRCLLIGCVITVFSVLIEFLANKANGVNGKRGTFLAGKIIQGYACALIKMVTLTYVSETVPTCLRGWAMALFPAFNTFGQLLGAVVVFAVNDVPTAMGYEIAFGVQWAFSAIPLVMSFVLPESPAYLVRKKDMEAARKSLQRLLAPKNDPDVALERLRLSIEAEERIASDIGYSQCFKGSNRRRTLIVIFANLLPPLFGLPLLTSASYFLQQVGMSSKYSLMLLIVGIVIGMFANFGSTWTLSHLNRRRLTINTCIVASLLWAAMGIAGCFQNDSITPWISGGIMMAVILVCGLGVWPTSYAIMSEASALRLRAKSQAIGGISAYVASIFTNFVLPYLYNPDAADLQAKTGFVFTGACVVAAVATYFIVPEMKGRSPMEIDHLFEERVSARKSAGWRDRTEEVKAAAM